MGRGSQLHVSSSKNPLTRVTVSFESSAGARRGDFASDLIGHHDVLSARLRQLLKTGKAQLVVARLGAGKLAPPIASLLGSGRRAHLALHLPPEGILLSTQGKRLLRSTMKKLLAGWMEEVFREAGKKGRHRKAPVARILPWKGSGAKP